MFILPKIEIQGETMRFAGTANGEMRMEIAVFFFGSEGRGGGIYGGLQAFEWLDVSFEPNPYDARIATRRKTAEAFGAQVTRSAGQAV